MLLCARLVLGASCGNTKDSTGRKMKACSRCMKVRQLVAGWQLLHVSFRLPLRPLTLHYVLCCLALQHGEPAPPLKGAQEAVREA